MKLQLEGKRALITGSSAGIGESIAKLLAQEGALIVVHGRNEKEVNRVAQEIATSGGKAIVAIGDLRTDEGAKLVADKALSVFGGIDILINNAGVYPQTSWMETAPQDWNEIFNSNITSMVRVMQYIIPQMKELGWGRIIQMSTTLGTSPWPSMPHYAASKAAIINLTVSLMKELTYTGITVNTVSPGPILTPGLEVMYREIAETKGWGSDWDEIEKHALEELIHIPSGRIGHVEDVANLVAFLSSPLAGYINGSNLRVDGGHVSTIN